MSSTKINPYYPDITGFCSVLLANSWISTDWLLNDLNFHINPTHKKRSGTSIFACWAHSNKEFQAAATGLDQPWMFFIYFDRAHAQSGFQINVTFITNEWIMAPSTHFPSKNGEGGSKVKVDANLFLLWSSKSMRPYGVLKKWLTITKGSRLRCREGMLSSLYMLISLLKIVGWEIVVKND